MRTLVDQTAHAVKEWFARLQQAKVGEDGVLPRREDVYLLMGGVDSGAWLEAPERPAVIVGTQDMLLSRALMRGYASSRAVWPMEFALLHTDAQWVFDEVQLMNAGRATSSQLEAFRRSDAGRAATNGQRRQRPARSLWISATLDRKWLDTVDYSAQTAIEVDPKTETDGRLARLVTAKKTLRRTNVAPSSAKIASINAYVNEFTDRVLDAHVADRMTLVIVNQVQRAQKLRSALEKKLRKQRTPVPELVLVHSRFRPHDRGKEMDKIMVTEGGAAKPADRIVVATQAVEAGVDVSAAVLFTELSPWASMVQRFGRANRYAELPGGADVYWNDLLGSRGEDDKDAIKLARPYAAADLVEARRHLLSLNDVASANLPRPSDVNPPRRVIRRKDLDDLFDTDSDLTGFDIDVSPYVRDADDTDIRVFWRDLSTIGDDPPRPHADELCAVPIGAAKDWLKKVERRSKGKRKPAVFVRDPQWRRRDGRMGTVPPGWMPMREPPWPGLTLLADVEAGGYNRVRGFTGNPKDVPEPVPRVGVPGNTADGLPGSESRSAGEDEGHDEDSRSAAGVPLTLRDHTRNVVSEAKALCRALDIEDDDVGGVVMRAAHWHDLGKAHEVFQDTMRRGLGDEKVLPGVLLAKTVKNVRHDRAYFRHELASALALLAHEEWSREADLPAYLVAAHHGKVRMNLRALPRESARRNEAHAGKRFARGIWENDKLQSFDMGGGERWEGGRLTLSVMELGWDENTHESWTERTRNLLARFGPFRLAWMETLVRIADWRASAKERKGVMTWQHLNH